jgi:ribonuclease HII
MAPRAKLILDPKKPARKAQPAPKKTSAKKETKAQRLAREAAKFKQQALTEWVCSWEFERNARAEGSRIVAGVDEVGRGPLFGPVVAAAVILPHDEAFEHHFEGLNDSKQLSEEDRELFDARVRESAIAWSIAEVDVQTIDRINILQASRLAMKIAVEGLRQRGFEPDHLLIDGNQKIDHCPPGLICRQTTIVQGDARSLSIAAASVIAKVHRDRLLRELDLQFPGYGLANNKGYATPEHRAALQRLGITEMHRRSFAPVAALFELEVENIELEFDLELPLVGD